MRARRSIVVTAVCCCAALLCEQAAAIDLRGDIDVLGQVREGDQTRETEAPHDVYGAGGIDGLWGRTSLDTFFRLERDFARDDGAADFYAGYARSEAAIPGVQFTMGRQFLNEGPGGVFVADAGKVRFDPGWPVAFTIFGGAPQYFEPTYGSDLLSQDEILWGGNMRSKRWRGGQFGLGYQQLERDDKVLRQLITATGTQSLTMLPGLPDLYGSFAYDADRQNLDLATGGANFVILGPRLMLNVEGTYYKPQDQESGLLQQDIDRREDPIFELFSVSRLLQFRGGLRYPVVPSLSAFADYSYQRYEQEKGDVENGHVGSVGFDWLPGGDGLEVVRLEYYVSDSGGGNVNGARAYYQNSVYERVIFRLKVDLTGYETESNQDDVPFSSFVGVGYELMPGLIGEVNLEANRNDRFDSDFRFGFRIYYNFLHRIGETGATREAA